MTNEPKLAPQAPASNDAAIDAAKSTTDAKPIVTPAPVDAPPADAKKS